MEEEDCSNTEIMFKEIFTADRGSYQDFYGEGIKYVGKRRLQSVETLI